MINKQPPSNIVNNQNGNFPIILSIFILLLVVGGGIYYLSTQINNPDQNHSIINSSPTNTEITDWITYESKRFKIKFKYPSKYVLVNTNENTYLDRGFIHLYTQQDYEFVKSEAGRGGSSFIEIGAYNNPKHLSALEWAKSDTAHSNFSGTYIVEKIANTEALSYTIEGMGTGYTRVLTHSDYIYTFDVLGNSEMVNDFKQILLTVEFVQ